MSDEPPTPPEPWVRVAITTDPASAELAVDVLWQCGAAGVEEQEVDGQVRLLGGFAARADADAAIARAAALGLAADALPVDDDGLDSWREWARPERAGRFWITPSWVAAPATGDGAEVLWLDPGRAFGSGSHPTTRLVLGLLQDYVAPDDAVLDVGCGSGVLAIGAARLGAWVQAIDIEAAAVAATRANAERNQVEGMVRASATPIEAVAQGDDRFQVVAANLLAPVIREVGDHLVRVVAPGGVLIVSGLLADRWERSMDALAPFVPERVDELDGWVAVVLTRPEHDQADVVEG